MLPQSLIAFTATLLVPSIAAASTPSCQRSNYGAGLDDFKNGSMQFCNKLANENFTLDMNMYGVQKSIIAFQFTPQNGATCNLNACSAGGSALAINCNSTSYFSRFQFHGIGANDGVVGAGNNDTIYGSGSTDLGCGTYNFTITPQTLPTLVATASQTASTAKPTSAGSVMRASGFAIVGVASVFAWLL